MPKHGELEDPTMYCYECNATICNSKLMLIFQKKS